jgi:tight adherence protein B
VTPELLWTGVAAVALGLFLLVLVLVAPRRPRVAISRLAPDLAAAPTRLSGAAEDTAALAARLLRRSGRGDQLDAALERAGIQSSPAEVLVIVGAGSVAGLAFGTVLAGPLLGLLLAACAPLIAVGVVTVLRDRRQSAFADQLDDALGLMAGSLRAGHSVLRALDAVSKDTEAPTSVEFSRVVNETRVGRDVNLALEEVADRTGSQDFAWVVQAIAIHREVGGNLADVLDRVSTTIRERNEMRRQASALSAEGRVSGVVLMLMPVVVLIILSVVAPEYVGRLTGTGTGVLLLAIAGGLMTVGGLWLRNLVKVRF